MSKILFYSPDSLDFCAHGLFHGLRSLLGARVVDFPKCEYMYTNFPPEYLQQLHGRGFTLGRTLPDIAVNRYSRVVPSGPERFDLIVIGSIWNGFGRFLQLIPSLRSERVVVIDGSDEPALYPYAKSWRRIREYWTLPRAHTRVTYFKRELTAETWASRLYGLVPFLLGRLPATGDVRSIAFSIPRDKIYRGDAQKSTLFPTHIVDNEVADRIEGATTDYAFASEDEYYADLRAARFGVTTKRAGWDCLRHYELAANGSVPCFRHLDRKPPTCAPHGLIDGVNCLGYGSFEELMERIAGIGPDAYARLRAGALSWAEANSTHQRATEFLEAVGLNSY